MPDPIGRADDPKTCAFCGRKVQAHSNFEFVSCRAALTKRAAAADVPVPTPTREEILDDLDEQISALEDKRKELTLEIEKEEILEKVLSGEIDLTPEQEKSLHENCHSEDEFSEVQEHADLVETEAWDYLQEFGSHTAACLSGALVGEKRPHPLCTCGWNHVATEAER